jgi:hypothetical protein
LSNDKGYKKNNPDLGIRFHYGNLIFHKAIERIKSRDSKIILSSFKEPKHKEIIHKEDNFKKF